MTTNHRGNFMNPTLVERRRTIARVANTLLTKPGPLTPIERDNLQRLTGELDQLETDIRSEARRKEAQAFDSWLRRGLSVTQFERGITNEERAALAGLSLTTRDMGIGVGQGAFPSATSGLFSPLEFSDMVTSAMKDTGAMLRVATIDTTPTGRLTPYPTDFDISATGERIPENTQVTSVDVAMNQTILSSYKFSSRLIKVSLEFLEDTGVDFSAWLAERFGVRLARAIDPDLLNGTGSGMPSGLLNAASVGAVAVGSSPNDGSDAGTNTIGQRDLENLIGSVDVAYRDRPTAGFILHSDVLTGIKKLIDKGGLPLKLFRSQHENASGIATLCSYPVYIDPNMPILQTEPSSPPVSIQSVLFGDLSKYRVRKTPYTVYRIVQRFSEYGQVAFLMLVRVDGALIDGSSGAGNGMAVKCLTNTY